jgi:hypothetical protein
MVRDQSPDAANAEALGVGQLAGVDAQALTRQPQAELVETERRIDGIPERGDDPALQLGRPVVAETARASARGARSARRRRR